MEAAVDPKSFNIDNRPAERDMRKILEAVKERQFCRDCYGIGLVSDSEDRESWLVWLALPPGSDLAVVMGLVQPMECPQCLGSGKRE